MSLVDEYEKRSKVPIIRVQITRFLSGETPSVLGRGTDYFPSVVSCSIGKGFDQGTATCSLVVETPKDVNGNDVKFRPMDRIFVRQGWNKALTFKTTFFGFIDTVDMSNPPKVQRLECRDILKLAEDNQIVDSNKYVYHISTSEDYPYPEDHVDVLAGTAVAGDPMGGQSEQARTVESIISTLLVDSGIPPSFLNLEFVQYPASGTLIIGNNAIAVFLYETALEAATRIIDLLGYKLWADNSGIVRCREVRSLASTTVSQSYNSQYESYDEDSGFTVEIEGNLISLETQVDDDLRNWIYVEGYGGLNDTQYAPSEYISTPPTYRRAEIKSYLFDTQAMVNTVSARVLSDLNRLRRTARAAIEGDPRVDIGQTVSLQDSFSTAGTENYFLFDFNSSFESGKWDMDLSLVGGLAGLGNIRPVAQFSSTVESYFDSSGDIFSDIYVDGSDSYDPDGSLEDLTFIWVCSGYSTVSGVSPTNNYVVTDSIPITVELTVVDSGSPPLSDSVAHEIDPDPGYMVFNKSIWTVADQTVFFSGNGGLYWIEQTLY